MTQHDRSHRRPGLAAALVVMLTVTACNSSTGPTPIASSPASSAPPATGSASPTGSASASPSGPESLEDTFATIEQQVRELRGLDEKKPVKPQLLSSAELGEKVQASFNRDNPADYVAASGRVYKRMGLLSADADLAELYVNLLESQVIGLYSTDDETLYVVSDKPALGPVELTTVAHEYTHALQDQQFDLDTFVPHQLDQGDHLMARTAVVEGDATELMFVWAQKHLTPAQFQQLVQTSGDPQQAEVINSMPAILREDLLFPYISGLQFLVSQKGGFGTSFPKTDEIFRTPPDTTEQILHPEKYAAREKAIPLNIPDDLAGRLGDEWSMPYVDTLGEFQLKVWLNDAGKIDPATASTAAAGWGGDRLALLEGPNGAWGVVAETAWDADDDAGQFHQAADTLVAKLRGSDRVGDVLARDPRSVTIVLADSAATMGKIANVLGLAG